MTSEAWQTPPAARLESSEGKQVAQRVCDAKALLASTGAEHLSKTSQVGQPLAPGSWLFYIPLFITPSPPPEHTELEWLHVFYSPR